MFRRQSGVSFIEILMSLLLLTVIFLSLTATQTTALTAMTSAYHVAVAQQQLMNMAERLSHPPLEPQLKIWNAHNRAVLPFGHGTVMSLWDRDMIDIFWGANDASTCEQDKMGEQGCLRLIVMHGINR